MKTFKNVDDFKEFLRSKNISNIHELLQKYTVKIHKPEYATNSIFTNQNGAFRVLFYWFSMQEGQRMLGYTDFVDHFKKTLMSDNFFLQISEAA